MTGRCPHVPGDSPGVADRPGIDFGKHGQHAFADGRPSQRLVVIGRVVAPFIAATGAEGLTLGSTYPQHRADDFNVPQPPAGGNAPQPAYARAATEPEQQSLKLVVGVVPGEHEPHAVFPREIAQRVVAGPTGERLGVTGPFGNPHLGFEKPQAKPLGQSPGRVAVFLGLHLGAKVMHDVGHRRASIGQRKHQSGRICAPRAGNQRRTLRVANSRTSGQRSPFRPNTADEGIARTWRLDLIRRGHQPMIGIVQPNTEYEELTDSGEVQSPATDRPAHSSPTLSTFLIGFGTILLLFTILRILNKVRRRAQSPREDPRATIARHRAEAHAAREPLENVMAEANELAVRLAKALDSKAARLEILIEQADERIAKLAADSYSGAMAPAAPQSSGMEAIRSLERQVLELADKGCDSDQIARRTGRSVGEVELILALRR